MDEVRTPMRRINQHEVLEIMALARECKDLPEFNAYYQSARVQILNPFMAFLLSDVPSRMTLTRLMKSV